MSRAIMADAELQRAFAADGYALVPILSPAEVEALLADFATLRPADGFAPEGDSGFGLTYHCSFVDTDLDYRRQALEILTRHFTPAIERHLDNYRILSANFYVKPPGRGELKVHQNWPVLPDHADTSVTLWCPLVDVDPENATLHVARGSHKLLPHVEGPFSPCYFEPFLGDIYRYLEPLNLKAGDGVIFDDGLVHGSPDNHGDRPRVAVQITCVPAESKPVFFFQEGPERFELVEADSEFYLTNSIIELCSRQPAWRHRGYRTNFNRPVGAEEFAAMLADPVPWRSRVLSGEFDRDPTLQAADPIAPLPPARRSLRNRLKRLLRLAA